MSYKKEIKILLVDDHKLVRAGLRNIIEQRSNMLIIGEASDGREAIKIACKITTKRYCYGCCNARFKWY